MALIDITRSVSPETAVWPGDRPVEWAWTLEIREGESVNLGAFSASTHAGTHVDAPLHVTADGAPVDALDPSVFVGPACVVDVSDLDPGQFIRPDRVASVEAPRVLFKTCASAVPSTRWPDGFPVVHPATVEALAERNAVLIGVDTPSVDPQESSDLPAHHALVRNEIVNLEHLRFPDAVVPGRYELLALPLRLSGADAAPVRAVLRPAA
jgi:arylformamidase